MLAYDPAAEEAELRAYLGPRYDRGRLERHHKLLEEEAERAGDDALLYRTSEAYLYDLTVFAMSRVKEPYLRALAALVPAPARILDLGCGIGADGLLLTGAGYEVVFADFDNPSTRYLRWRLERRGLDAVVHDVDRGPPPGRFDAAYCFDVLEHVEDPFAMLATMEACADLVCVNVLEPVEGETCLHHELPVAELLDHAASHRLRLHRLLHGRSHLLAYEPRPARAPRRAWQRAAVRLRAGARRR